MGLISYRIAESAEGMGCYTHTRTDSEDADTRSAEIAYYGFIVFKREPALSCVRCYPVEYRWRDAAYCVRTSFKNLRLLHPTHAHAHAHICS
jgi:hypothetical protein